MQDFPFTIRDVASVMNLRIRHRNTVSLDVDCPLCDDRPQRENESELSEECIPL